MAVCTYVDMLLIATTTYQSLFWLLTKARLAFGIEKVSHAIHYYTM